MSVHLTLLHVMRGQSSVQTLKDPMLVNARLVTPESKGNVYHGMKLMISELRNQERSQRNRKRKKVVMMRMKRK